MSGSGTLRVVRRTVSTAPALSAFIIVVVAVLSFLGAAAPVVLHDARTATIQREIRDLPPTLRSASAGIAGLPHLDARPTPGAGVWGGAIRDAEAGREALPQPLRGLLGAPRIVSQLDPLPSFAEGPIPKNTVALVADPLFADRTRITQGRAPESGAADAVEVAVSEEVARQLEWPVGTARTVTGARLLLTGLFAPRVDDHGDWAFLAGALEPRVEITPDGDVILNALAFTDRDEVTAFVPQAKNAATPAWMLFDVDRLDAEDAPTVAQQLRLLASNAVRLRPETGDFHDTGLLYSSGAPEAIDRAVARGEAMTAVVTVAAIGPVAVAVVALALCGRMLALRRVRTVRLMQARGASTAQLVALLGGEGLALGLVGAVLGAGAALVLPGWDGALSLFVPLILALVPAVVLPASALAEARTHARRDLGAPVGTRPWARLAVEGVVLLATAALVALLLTRQTVAGAVDPLLIVLPVLLGASGSILALRVLPPLLGVIERRGARMPGLIALLGPARARRDPSVRTAPVLAVVVGIGVAVFSVVFAGTVSAGIARTAQTATGADLRISAGYVPPGEVERIAGIPGVERVAPLYADLASELDAGARTVRIRLYVVDRQELAAVQDGRAAALPLPPALSEPADGAVPVVASRALLDLVGQEVGDVLEVGGTPTRVVGAAPDLVPFGSATRWIIVDRANAADLDVRRPAISRLFASLATGADAAAVDAAVRDVLGPDIETTAPGQIVEELSEDPAYRLVVAALAAACVLVALLLGVTVAVTLVLGAAGRGRLLALLRTLGHRRRDDLAVVAWEVVPALAVALPFGLVAGAGMSWLVIGAIDLRGFVGGVTQPPLDVGGALPAAVIGGFVLVAAAAIAVATRIAGRVGSAEAIRSGDEEG